MRPEGLSEEQWHAPEIRPQNPDWDRPHGSLQSFHAGGAWSWHICGCGHEASHLAAHVAEAESLTKDFLEALDASKHISYWCGIHDHCCCTDVDWDICNCACHKTDSEEAYCRKRLARWKRARKAASQKLAKDGL